MTPACQTRFSQAHGAPALTLPDATAQSAAQILDHDEIIELSIKPSLWYIPIVSARTLAGCATLALLVVAVSAARWSPLATVVLDATLLAAAARLLVASMQWGGRLYVLTNRRVLRFRGVLSVEVDECKLRQVAGIELRLPWYQPLLRVGSVSVRCTDAGCRAIDWAHVDRPRHVHDVLVRAVQRARS